MESWTNELSASFRKVDEDRVIGGVARHDHYAEFITGVPESFFFWPVLVHITA